MQVIAGFLSKTYQTLEDAWWVSSWRYIDSILESQAAVRFQH